MKTLQPFTSNLQNIQAHIVYKSFLKMPSYEPWFPSIWILMKWRHRSFFHATKSLYNSFLGLKNRAVTTAEQFNIR